MYKNKRGVSEVISTILIILVVLAAVVIVWQVVSRMIKGTGEDVEKKLKCVDVSLEILSVECMKGAPNILVTLKRGADPVGLGTLMVSATDSAGDSVNIPADNPITIDVLGVRRVTLSATGKSAGDTTTVSTGITLDKGTENEVTCEGTSTESPVSCSANACTDATGTDESGCTKFGFTTCSGTPTTPAGTCS